MSNSAPSNLAASVRQRLLNLSRTTGENFVLVLARYAVERCLYRLSVTPHTTAFILKGAMLFRVWTGQSHRPTTDLDLLARGDDSIERLRQVFGDICAAQVEPDGLQFRIDTIRITDIRENQEYVGRRVQMVVLLGKMRIPVQVDIGFGDAAYWGLRTKYPTLLDFPAPLLQMYPKEFVISEKLQAAVVHAELNSRMKDFYDICFMSRQFSFKGSSLSKAIRQTFERRRTKLVREAPVALQEDFAEDPIKQIQWQAFLRRSKLTGERLDFKQVISEMSAFLVPPLLAVAKKEKFNLLWSPGGPWVKKEERGA